MLRRMTLPRLLLLGATILGLLTAAQHFTVMQITAVDPSWKSIAHALSSQMPFWYIWVVLAPVAVWALQRQPLVQGRLAVSIPFHIAVAGVCILAHSALLLAAHRLLGFPTGTDPFWITYGRGILYRLPQGLLGYTILFGAVLAADYYDRFRERERAAATLAVQLSEARLQALRMQLNPHFLFNTLNTIAMLVRRQDSHQAVRVLASLSDILRYVLEDTPPQEVPLRQELAFIDRYLAIERSRFPDRLHVSVDVPPDALDALVPNLVLQPLVENAVRHGIGKRAAAGRIEIAAQRNNGDLQLEVRDDGPGLGGVADLATPGTGLPLATGGIGIRNTRGRLSQLYGDHGSLELLNRPEGGTVARVQLPWRVAAAGEVTHDVAGVS